MSKTLKRKITVELPKPRDLSKNRLSVFQRLGTRKHKTLEPNSNTDDVVQFPSNVTPTAARTIEKPESVALEDADPDLLEKKRDELQKELELQLKMETTRKTAKEGIRKRKKVQTSSSSSSSSSDSSSSDSSSSSSSKESKRKIKRTKPKRRNSSSSSDEPRIKKTKVKRVCHKKTDPVKVHKTAHAKKTLTQTTKTRKRSQSPSAARKRVPVSPSRLNHKQHSKLKQTSEGIPSSVKHHRLKDPLGRPEKERDTLHQRDRERERERLRSRDKERGRSRTPKFHTKSRSPKLASRSRDISHKSSPRRAITPTKSRPIGSGRRDRTPDRLIPIGKKDHKRHASSRDRDRDRREKERQDREAAREKERAEILARCQERQRERERLARENARRDREREDDRSKSDRLLPRPAERAMALAAARDRSRDKSRDRDRPRSHSHGRIGRDRIDRDKDMIPYDRSYDREDPRYDHMDRRYEKDDRTLLDERERYMAMRRREESRGHSPYAVREKRLERDDIEREMYMGGGDQRYDDHIREDHREPIDYPARGYVDDRHRLDREREWMRENELVHEQDRRLMYDHPQDRLPVREWDRPELAAGRSGPIQDNYTDTREWHGGGAGGIAEHQWDTGANWPQETEEPENWDTAEDKEWQEYHRLQEKMRHDTSGTPSNVGPVANVGNVGGNSGGGGRRWTNWRNRRGNHHNSGPGGGPGTGNDYRRHNIHNQPAEGYANRGDPNYNRRPLHQKPENQVPVPAASDISHLPTTPRHPITNTPKIETDPSPAKSVQSEPNTIQITPSTPVVIPTPAIVAVEEKPDTKKDDSIDEPEEQIPDDLSEISGDDADDILNRQEDEAHELAQLQQPIPTLDSVSKPIHLSHDRNVNNLLSSQLSSDGNDAFSVGQYFRPDYEPELQDKTVDQHATEDVEATMKKPEIVDEIKAPVDEVTPQQPPLAEQPTPSVTKTDSQESSKDVPEEMDLDFEEISDGELEEEARIRGLGDALGVDWASLVEESKAIAKEKSAICNTTAKQRWQPHRILLDVGISLKMGGSEFVTKVLSEAYATLEKEKLCETDIKIKIEPKDEDDIEPKEEPHHNDQTSPIISLKKMVKIEPGQDDFSYHPIACVQVASRTNMEKRKNLIFNATGPYSRALCSHRDLQMRRQLCGLPIGGIDRTSHKKSIKSNSQSEHAKIAWELFQKSLGKVN